MSLEGAKNEHRCENLAELAAAGTVFSPCLPALHLCSIQGRRAAPFRWHSRLVCSPAGSLQVLLEAFLLVFSARRGVSVPSLLCSDRRLDDCGGGWRGGQIDQAKAVEGEGNIDEAERVELLQQGEAG